MPKPSRTSRNAARSPRATQTREHARTQRGGSGNAAHHPRDGKKNASAAPRRKEKSASSRHHASHASRRPHLDPKTRERALARCPKADRCGACPMIGIDYAQQLERKQEQLKSLFAAHLDENIVLHPILGMERPERYRNKVISPFAAGEQLKSAEGRSGKHGKTAGKRKAPQRAILTGMYAAGSHRLVNTDGCLVENEAANRVVSTIRTLMPRFRIEPYDEDAHTGFLRHVVVRVGHASNEMLVTLVTNGTAFPGSRNFCRELVKRCPEITTVVQNVNTRQTNVILGDEGETTLYGPGFILDELCGLSFRISSHSFYQVNAVQTEVLYRRAIQMARFTGGETALDAYCGTGTIGLCAAKGLPDAPEAHAARVIGVDKVEEAIADARSNARHNGIDNADFAAEDAGDFMQRLAQDGEALDVLLLDPPRAGASTPFLEAACTLAPARIVYISCNPQSQARDAGYLLKRGYRLTEIQGVDMFPHTAHIECICAFERIPNA